MTGVQTCALPIYFKDSNLGENEHTACQGIDNVVWVREKQTASQRFAQQAEPSKVEKTEIPPQYREFRSIFEEKESKRLPEHQPWDHVIKVKPGFKSRKLRDAYPIPPKLQPVYEKWMKENLDKGYI